MTEYFSPFRHVPQFSRLLVGVLLQPVIVYLVLVGNAVLMVAALVFFALEADVNPAVDSVLDAVWWAFSTVTTVGYGDVVPVTMPGRFVGLVLMVGGVSLFVAFTGYLVASVVRLTTQELHAEDLNLGRQLRVLDAHLREVSTRLGEVEANIQQLQRPRPGAADHTAYEDSRPPR